MRAANTARMAAWRASLTPEEKEAKLARRRELRKQPPKNPRKHDPEFMEKNRARTREWGRADPERKRASNRRCSTGWEPEEYEAAWARQRGLCAICGIPMKRGGRGKGAAAADHCHVTGRTRGIPCQPCNMGLGAYADSPLLLVRAAIYLISHGHPIEADVDGIPVVLPY